MESRTNLPPLRAALLNAAALSAHAARLAQEHHITTGNSQSGLLKRLNDNKVALNNIYKSFTNAAAGGKRLTSAAEWFLDNYYVISGQLRDVTKACTRELMRGLPVLTNGELSGKPRLYDISLQIITHSDGQVDLPLMSSFLIAYQETTVLQQKELKAIPVILQLAIIENLRRIAWAIRQDNFSGSQEDALQIRQRVTDKISLRNNLSSLRIIGRADWSEVITGISVIDKILSEDPSGVYTLMDFYTKKEYWDVIETMTLPDRLTEQDVALSAIQLSVKNSTYKGPDHIASHVGFYLTGEGRAMLEKKAGIKNRSGKKIKASVNRVPVPVYICMIGMLTLFITAGLLAAASIEDITPWLLVLIAFPTLIAESQLGIIISNSIITYSVKPGLLPRLDFSKGIPENFRTLVIVPCMLIDEEEIDSLVDDLEVRFLANRDKHLHFGLLTDLKDAKEAVTPTDEILVQYVAKRIDALNSKYREWEYNPFFLFHRSRRWNKQENCWMGYERKRGKLSQLNALLYAGDRGDFSTIAGDHIPAIRYVITVDKDTQLPRDSAWKLIATMAHPLNKAFYDQDKKRITSGYGILQPRVGMSLPESQRSLYIRMQGNNTSIDAYTRATSDLYQDLFDEGSFVGKGIYDVEIFAKTLADRFPENRILSHDLLEGCFMRSGLVTEVQFLEEHPISYYADTRRRHRWIRGDWQIASYALPFRKNSLSLLSRWKIFDNLRRSLIPMAYLALLLFGWTVSQHAWLWTCAVVLNITFPACMDFTLHIISKPKKILQWQHWQAAVEQVSYSIVQSGYAIACLPYEAYYTGDAVVRTLIRLFITKKNLLQWNQSGERANKQVNSLRATYSLMWINVFIPISMFIALAIVFPQNLPAASLMFSLWLLAPAIAWRVSLPPGTRKTALSATENAFLHKIARKTWAFVEHFTAEHDNWLPPDYYQEHPLKRVSHRTSPTNMGLALTATVAALDFGYITNGVFIARLGKTLDAMNKLERFRGHFYNWYDTHLMKPVKPVYVSTVDSGNLASHLIIVCRSLRETTRRKILGIEQFQGLGHTLSILEEEIKYTNLLQEIKSIIHRTTDINSPAVFQTTINELVTAAEKLTPHFSRNESGHHNWLSTLYRQIHDINDEMILLAPWLIKHTEIPTLEKLAIDNCPPATERLAEINRLEALCRLFIDQEYGFLYDKSQKLLSIGFSVEKNQRDSGCYDMLASEARVATFIGIAQGKLPQESWFALGRPLVNKGGEYILLSWSGSMFEFLMPQLVMPTYEHSLLKTAGKVAVKKQIEYARKKGVPWGISECAYNEIDINLCYQYGPFGVPGLGLQRGLEKDLIIAPYASMLGLMVAPHEACNNLQQLSAQGLESTFGFYDAVDYTSSHLSNGSTNAIVRLQMMHHQCMGFLSLAHLLLDGVMQKRFAADPSNKTALILLEEPVAPGSAFTLPEEDERQADKTATAGITTSSPVCFNKPADASIPTVQLLSNGRYHVMLTDAGAGYSRWNDLALTRWREDGTCDNTGMFCYIKDVDEGAVWSAGYQPTCVSANNYTYAFAEGVARFRRSDDGLETNTTIVVSQEDDLEIRRMCIKNVSPVKKRIEVTSYAEVVLAPAIDDAWHPAFSKIFVETAIDKDRNAIFCIRRSQSAQKKPPCMFHMMKVDGPQEVVVSYETDRLQFIGRKNTIADPAAINKTGPMSENEGGVVDPVVSIRYSLTLAPGQDVNIDMISGVGENRMLCEVMALKYQEKYRRDFIFELAEIQARAILKRIQATDDEIQLFRELAGFVVFANDQWPADAGLVAGNKSGQSALWNYSISGDLPIVLLKVAYPEDIELAEQLMQAHAYWNMKGLAADLVIWNEDTGSYAGFMQSHLMEIAGRMDNTGHGGGTYIMSPANIPSEDRILLQAAARIIISAREGTLAEQLQQRIRPLKTAPLHKPAIAYTPSVPIELTLPDLQFFNGIGGFSQEGHEYLVISNDEKCTPMPWTNVLANPGFGTVISESGQSYTWAANAHEFRLTPWYSDPVSDPSGEAFYLRDEEDGHFWSPTALPAANGAGYITRHGFGYSIFECATHGIYSEMKVFVDIKEPVKFTILKIRNQTNRSRHLSVSGYVEWVLGDMKERSGRHVVTERDKRSGAIFAHNHYNTDFAGKVAFFNVCGRDNTYTSSRPEFIGRNGSLHKPAAMRNQGFLNKVDANPDSCAAFNTQIELAPGEEREVIFLLGVADNFEDATKLALLCEDAAAVHHALQIVSTYWKNLLGNVQITTPDPALNILTNGWLVYQTLAARYWGRSGYYQSSGAIGFRDQLQDTLALLHIRPEFARDHILLCASRQFQEGDVLHWWHPPLGRGIRTRCSDDYLWLPFSLISYVKHTGDRTLLDEPVHFLQGGTLVPGETSCYGTFDRSSKQTAVYDHCVRAIRYGLKFGVHGLPLIGSGDWNDSMDYIGEKGKGESVWLAFFLYYILEQFSDLAYEYGDTDFAEFCRDQAEQLSINIDKHAWDGNWFLRAFFDDGTPMGSADNTECSIDCISQSWSVLSGAVSNRRSRIAIESAFNHLVRKDLSLIQLLDPPFNTSTPDPGYIKGYAPGIRENGGQYTHAATWLIMAFAESGNNTRVAELLKMINPVYHSDSPAKKDRYKLEPYVMAADIYISPPYAGRGGWSWYTGSAGCMYRLMLEYILGLKVEGDQLTIKPCLPPDWDSFKIKYTYKQTHYHIIFEAANIPADNDVERRNVITLVDDRREHWIKISGISAEISISSFPALAR